jgi:sulfur-carrier protein
MAKIKFTSALKTFFPSLTDLELEGKNIHEVLIQIETLYPGISNYLLDETGTLRKHVNIFLQGDLIKDRSSLSDPVKNSDELLIFQALSGG